MLLTAEPITHIESTISITFLGRVPSKKNSKRMVMRGRKPILLSSEAYIKWEETQLWLLTQTPKLEFEAIGCVASFWFPDARTTDLSNKWESIADCLVKANVLPDDSVSYLTDVRLLYKGIDRINPRVELMFFPVVPIASVKKSKSKS